MSINIIFTGKLCNELFTGDMIYFRTSFNPLDSFEET